MIQIKLLRQGQVHAPHPTRPRAITVTTPHQTSPRPSPRNLFPPSPAPSRPVPPRPAPSRPVPPRPAPSRLAWPARSRPAPPLPTPPLAHAKRSSLGVPPPSLRPSLAQSWRPEPAGRCRALAAGSGRLWPSEAECGLARLFDHCLTTFSYF